MSNNSSYIPFLNRHNEILLRYILKRYPFTNEELKQWRDLLNWEFVALNRKIPWSLELFREFDEELTMREDKISEELLEKLKTCGAKPGQYFISIYNMKKFPWSEEFIDFAKDKLTWFLLTQHWPLKKSVEMLDRYADYHDFFFISKYWDLPWSADLLQRHADKWDYEHLTHRLTWAKHINKKALYTLLKLDPKNFQKGIMSSPRNRKLPSVETDPSIADKKQRILHSDEPLVGEGLIYALETFGIGFIINNSRVNWTPGLIDYLSDHKDWAQIFNNSELPVNEALIEKYIDKIPFGKATGFYSEIDGISSNRKIPWSVPFIKKYKERWNWWQLSNNWSIPPSEEMLEAFNGLWDWEGICNAWGEFWTHERIRKYAGQVNWTSLSGNEELSFTPALLEEFEEKWDTSKLRKNKAFRRQVLKKTIDAGFIQKYINSLV